MKMTILMMKMMILQKNAKNNMSAVLQTIDICKDFTQANNKISVLKNINLQIMPADFVSLVGPSGSGKTTLLQICGLLDNPTSGKIIIDGKEMAKSSDKIRTEIRKNKIGFIYQFHHLLPEFSAIENTALPLFIQGVNKSKALKIAKEILEEIELGDRIDFKPAQLSGGQQQRVAIARAIASKPKLILADEPTGNLDSELSEKIFSLLKNLTKKYEISCLVVTHNLELAKKTDRILTIKNGFLSE
ncbi:MAG: ABC transporter ATP-binding protein [Alphaproteobacteria bacterium]